MFLWVAKEKGYYEQEGLDVEFLFGKGSTFSAQMVGSGKVEIGQAAANTALVSRAAGMPIVSLATIYPDTQSCVISLKEKNILEPEDLYGRTIAVNKNTANYMDYKSFLQENGLDSSKIDVLHTTENILMLTKGEADGFVIYAANEVYLEREGYEVNKICFKDNGLKLHGTVIITNEKTLEDRPEMIRKFLRATFRGMEYTYENPEESYDIFYNANPDIDYDLFKEMYYEILPQYVDENTAEHGFGYQSAEKWANNVQMLLDQGLLNETMPMAQIYTNSFLPNS